VWERNCPRNSASPSKATELPGHWHSQTEFGNENLRERDTKANRLLALRAHHHGRNIGRIDRCVEKLSSGQLGKMDQLIAHLFDFAADLLAGFHSQLNRLPDIFLEDAQNGIAGLQIDLALREEIGASKRNHNPDEK